MRSRYHAPGYHGSDKLKGKVALVTGGDSGIGRAVAVLLAREGADVAIVYPPAAEGDAQETGNAVDHEGRRCVLLPGDVRDPKFCERAVAMTVYELGHLDILVNNAPVHRHQDSRAVTDEQPERSLHTNVSGYIYMAQAAVPRLPRGGAIVNAGAIAGLAAAGEPLDDPATRAAIHAFTRTLAKDLLRKGIRVNCVLAGAGTPPLRPAQPDEISPAYVFLASNLDSSHITGEVLTLLAGDGSA